MGHSGRIVLHVIEDFGGACPLDEVSALCPELTGAQVFQALQEFAQSGDVHLLQDTQGTYFVVRVEGIIDHARVDAPLTGERRGVPVHHDRSS